MLWLLEQPLGTNGDASLGRGKRRSPCPAPLVVMPALGQPRVAPPALPTSVGWWEAAERPPVRSALLVATALPGQRGRGVFRGERGRGVPRDGRGRGVVPGQHGHGEGGVGSRR